MIRSIVKNIESLSISPLGIVISRAFSTTKKNNNKKNAFYDELEHNRKLENLNPNPNIKRNPKNRLTNEHGDLLLLLPKTTQLKRS